MGVVYACALSFMSKYLYQSCGPKPMTRVDINNQSSNTYMCFEKWRQHTPLIISTQEYHLTIQFLKRISFKVLVCYASFKVLVRNLGRIRGYERGVTMTRFHLRVIAKNITFLDSLIEKDMRCYEHDSFPIDQTHNFPTKIHCFFTS